LPDKFVRIRHFGMLGSRQKNKNVESARKLLGSQMRVEVVKSENYKELLARVVGVDIDKCASCDTGKMMIAQTFLPHLPHKRRLDTS